MYKHNRGFTLIELLVVISIIGMLSSVVLASLQSARDKGRVSAGVRFSAYNFRAIGINSILNYSFDDTNGTSARDDSGGNFNLALINCNSGAFCRSSTIKPGVGGNSLALNNPASSQYGEYANSSGFTSAAISEMTTSMWFYADTLPTTATSFRLMFAISDSPIANQNSDRDLFMDLRQDGTLHVESGTNCYQQYPGVVTSGKWYNVTVSVKRVAGVSSSNIYLDGKLLGSPALCFNNFQPRSVSVGKLGGVSDSANYFDGHLDDIVVYSKSLTTEEVQYIYAQGAAERNLTVAQ